MVGWENYPCVYNIEFERRKVKKVHVSALLLADFSIDDLECLEDSEVQEVFVVEPLLENLSNSPHDVEIPNLQK